MKSVEFILNETKLKDLEGKKEGRPEKFYICYDDRNGTNIYCEQGQKNVFAPIEKMSFDEVEKYAFKDLKDKAKQKLQKIQSKYSDKDLELVSEFKLAKYF